MPQFLVDDDLAALVEKLARPKPFEHLTFNNALRRVLESFLPAKPKDEIFDLNFLVEESMLAARKVKKAASPDARQWVESVAELRGRAELTSWKAVCQVLGIETAGDSARRRLKNWVKEHKPSWPQVPDAIDS